jgi:hypothetical protein
MKRQGFHKNGQAAVELAIWASLVVLAFSWVLSFGQKLDIMQRVKMEAFRNALHKAYNRNASVDYTLKKSIRDVSLDGGYGQGKDSGSSSSMRVMWVKGTAGAQGTDTKGSFGYYKSNTQYVAGGSVSEDSDALPMYEKNSVSYDGSRKEVYYPVTVWNDNESRQLNYNSTLTKAESTSNISYVVDATATDTTSGTAYTHFDNAVDTDPWDDDSPDPEYTHNSSNTYSTTDTYSYQRSWTVPHD